MLDQVLRDLRRTKNLSQRDLAAGICSRTYVTEVEQGDRFPAPQLLAQLATRLGVPLAHFVDAYLASPMAGIPQCLALARQLAARGALDEAERILSEVTRRLGREPRAQNYTADLRETLGILRYQAGRVEEALAAFRAALELRSKAPSRRYALARAWFRVGWLAMEAGSQAEAREALYEAFDRILWLNPAECREKTEKVVALHERTVQALGLLLLRARDLHAALQVYRTAEERWHAYGILADPAPDVRLGHALAEMGTGRFEVARRRLAELAEPDHAPEVCTRAQSNLGVLARLEGDWQEARRRQTAAWWHYEREEAGEPRAICNELARCGLHAGDLAGAETWLERAGAEDPAARDPALAAETHLVWARYHRARGDAAAAVRSLDAAETFPGAAPALLRLVTLERLRLALPDGVDAGVQATLARLEADLDLLTL